MKAVRLLTAAVVATGFMATLPASAADLTGTLAKINESGEIVIGHRESSVPFAYATRSLMPSRKNSARN